eukprot:SAG31_NODE_18279_length_641_cov_1.322878_1_plen_77_part_10
MFSLQLQAVDAYNTGQAEELKKIATQETALKSFQASVKQHDESVQKLIAADLLEFENIYRTRSVWLEAVHVFISNYN